MLEASVSAATVQLWSVSGLALDEGMKASQDGEMSQTVSRFCGTMTGHLRRAPSLVGRVDVAR